MPKNLNYSFYSPHVSALVKQFVPDHVIAQYPKLIDFIKAYFNYLEDVHGSAYYQNALPEQRRLETQDEQFLARIEKEIGLFVPREYAATPRVFYNKISELWRSKGSKEGIETFFRIFLNDPVEITFPWDRVLKPSDGVWLVEDKIRISPISGDPLEFAGKEIIQLEDLGIGKVTKVSRKVYSNEIIYELNLLRSDIVGEFKPGNTISVEGTNLIGEIYRSVTKLNILNGGSNYQVGDKIILNRLEGTSFTAFVTAIDINGSILGVSISDFGSGNTPNHIKESNETELYYLKDFELFEYSTDEKVQGVDAEFRVLTKNGQGAEFSLSFGPITTSDGKYFGVKGQLSEDIVLQDSKFYQRFSYEVITNFPIKTWLSPLKKTTHTAGTEVFANVKIFDKIDLSVKGYLYSDVTLPPNYGLGENENINETLEAFSQDYYANYENDILTPYYMEPYYATDISVEETLNSTEPPLPPEDLAIS